MRSSVAKFWNTRTGSAELSTVTALVRRMRLVRAAAAPRITAGAESRKSLRWCSPIPKTSKPTWSAYSICSIRFRMRSVGLSARVASSCAAAKLSIPISTRSLRHFTLYAAIAGAACELTDAQHLPFHVQLRKTNDIHATLTDERPMLHDRYVLSLSGVKHNQ